MQCPYGSCRYRSFTCYQNLPCHTPGKEATVHILAKNTVLTLLFQGCHVCWTLRWHHISIMETFYIFHLLFFFFFYVGILVHYWLPLGGILSLHETQERFCALENVTRAPIDIGVSSKWVKPQFGVKKCYGLPLFPLYNNVTNNFHC